MTGPEPQLIRCRPAHDVCILFSYDEPLVRAVSAPLRILLVCCSYAIKDGAPPSVLPLEPSPWCDVSHRLHHRYRHLHPIVRPVACQTSEITLSLSLLRRGFVLAAAFRMSDTLVQCLSRSIQCCWLVPDTTFDALLSTAHGRTDIYLYVTPSRYSLSPMLLVLSDRLPRSQTKYHVALTQRSPSSRPCALCRQQVFA
ncbi:hypothetical protein K438DRAFT_1997257 [Mycena galopus ATCC 62051]|nr:hypothetical protein K438DRAFT_1997257 [Mycena galopus ATCC 62051]